MIKQLYILPLLILLTYSGLAQQFLNFNFEKESVEGLSRPWGWDLDSWGLNSFFLDSTTTKDGFYSLRTQADSAISQRPALQANLEPYLLSGKTIELRGYYKSKFAEGKSTISSGYASIDSAGNYSDSSAIIFETLDSNTDWKLFHAPFQVPENSISVFIKFGIEGKGTIWYDDLWLLVDGKEYRELPAAPSFTKKEMQWISDASKPLGNLQDDTIQSINLHYFRSEIGSTRIVALGESTHGTSEFFKLKHHVFTYAVEQLGFRVFALEDHMLACEKVNQYILGDLDISIEESMSHLFAVWYTEEMKHLIQWMRGWNEKHLTDPVFFVGFDLQNYELPLAAINSYLTSVHPILLEKLKGYEDFAKNINTTSDSLKSEWIKTLNQLYDLLQKLSSESAEDLSALQNVNLLRQYTKNILKGHWSLYRDEAMANNVEWLANTKYPQEKIFVWAHDVHIAKSNHPVAHVNLNQGIAMGHFLDQLYGDDYRAYGISTYSGRYLALKSYTDYTRVHAPLYQAPEGSMEEALHRVSQAKNREYLFLTLDNSQDWLNRPLPFRFANHVNIDYGFFTQISLPHQFDGLFFIDDTSPSTYLK